MKIIDKALKRFGLVRARKLRFFSGAHIGRTTSTWATTTQSADREIRGGLRVLRARSRELASNNDYMERFLTLLKNNVVGPVGIRLQSKAQDPSGGLDKEANKIIETAWKEFTQPENCEVTGKFSMKSALDLIIESVARDGDVLIREIGGYPGNKFRYAIQLVEADHLDERLNTDLANGNRIKMGVELNPLNKPVRYHINKYTPGEPAPTFATDNHQAVDASEIIHPFISYRISQNRGVPWVVQTMVRLHQLGGYEEAEVIAARVAASQMGMYKSPDGDFVTTGGETPEGKLIYDAEPGTFNVMPPGYELQMFDPKHPNTSFDEFRKGMLKGAASGLNVSYPSLASDLEGVNYSSIRAGLIEERSQWRSLQGWMITYILNRIFSNWLAWSMLSGAVPLPDDKYSKFNKPVWIPRGWQWVDPKKDMEANKLQLEMGLTAPSILAAEQGLDFEEIVEQAKIDKQILVDAGITSLPGNSGQGE